MPTCRPRPDRRLGLHRRRLATLDSRSPRRRRQSRPQCVLLAVCIALVGGGVHRSRDLSANELVVLGAQVIDELASRVAFLWTDARSIAAAAQSLPCRWSAAPTASEPSGRELKRRRRRGDRSRRASSAAWRSQAQGRSSVRKVRSDPGLLGAQPWRSVTGTNCRRYWYWGVLLLLLLRYFTMRKLGMPDGVIQHKLMMDGVTLDILR